MKKITSLLIVAATLFSLNCSAQMVGGRGRGGMGGYQQQPQPQQQQQQEIKVNFIGATGYFMIESKDVFKRINVKKDEAKKEAILEVINRYTTSCQDLVEVYRKELDILEFAKENIESARGNMTAMREVMKGVTESNRTVKPELIKIHQKLNEDMEELLSAKDLKGWKRYYKSVCRENSFTPTPPKDLHSAKGGRSQGAEDRPHKERAIDSQGRPTI